MKRVLYSGIFDLLHLGHIMAFKEAKKSGDYLIIYVASDKETKAVKGALRPIIPAKERVQLIKELRCVDEVFTSDEYMTDEEVIKACNADVMIRNEGSVDIFSIEVSFIKRCVPKSALDTTGIIKKIQSKPDQKPLAGINYILRNKNKKILFQRREDKRGIRCPNSLVIPGGKLEKGENPHMCAARELKEETGLDLHPKHFEFFMDFPYPWGETNRFYMVELDYNPEIQNNEGKMEWHSLDENLELCRESNQTEILKKIKKYYEMQ